MAISITNLSGGNTPADGSDPRTFPAIWNATATDLEGVATDLDTLEATVGAHDLNSLSGVGITTPVEGDLLTYNGTSWVNGVPAGSILQVVSVTKTDTFSASVATGNSVAVTDLSITHTLANASNKLLISAYFGVAANGEGRGNVSLAVKDGSSFIGVGDAASSRPRVGAGGRSSTNDSNEIAVSPAMTFVYEPGDTSAHTYTVHAVNLFNAERLIFVNRTEGDLDDARGPRSSSSLVIQEVAG